jgi:hypothetical protein
MKNMNCLGLKLSSHASQKCDFPLNESRGLLLGLGLGSWSDHNIGMITTAGVQGAAPLGKISWNSNTQSSSGKHNFYSHNLYKYRSLYSDDRTGASEHYITLLKLCRIIARCPTSDNTPVDGRSAVRPSWYRAHSIPVSVTNELRRTCTWGES